VDTWVAVHSALVELLLLPRQQQAKSFLHSQWQSPEKEVEVVASAVAQEA
jgi:hypothetical protein